MNIQNVENTNTIFQNSPLQANEGQGAEQNQNAAQNTQANQTNRDNYTQTSEAERMQELTNRRDILREELGNTEREDTAPEARPDRTAELREELNGVEREMENMARQNDGADRRRREAIDQYSMQNQIARAQNNDQEVMNLFGE